MSNTFKVHENGVALTFVIGAVTSWCCECSLIDIDVPAGVTEVAFCPSLNNPEFAYGIHANLSAVSVNVSLKPCMKQFPDVRRLVIGRMVHSVSIRNSMFPNVEEVDGQDSVRFQSGPCLVEGYRGGRKKLLNTFYHRGNGAVDLDGIEEVCQGAFSGCLAPGVVNAGRISYCHGNPFKSASFVMEQCGNKSMMAGSVLVGTNASEEEGVAIFPAGVTFAVDDANLGIETDTVEFLDARSMEKTARQNLPACVKRLRLHLSGKDSLSDAVSSIRMACSKSCIEYIEAIDGGGSCYSSRDGLLYDKSGRVLLYCPSGRKGDLSVPEGTVRIAEAAFCGMALHDVSFPASLREVAECAFCRSSITGALCLGSGVELVNATAFSTTSVKEVVFSEGLRYIGDEAFAGAENADVVLPGTLLHIGSNNFRQCKKITVRNGLGTSGVLHAVSGERFDYDHPDSQITEVCVPGEGGFTAFVPRTVAPGEFGRFASAWDNGALDARIANTAFDCAFNAEAKQDAALDVLSKQPGNEDARMYLRRAAGRMAKRYISDMEADAEKLLKLVSMDLIPANTYKSLIKAAEKAESATAKAYLMDGFNHIGGDKSTFRL